MVILVPYNSNNASPTFEKWLFSATFHIRIDSMKNYLFLDIVLTNRDNSINLILGFCLCQESDKLLK